MMYLVGSKMLGLDNCHDTDYVCFNQNKRTSESGVDCFCRSKVETCFLIEKILKNPTWLRKGHWVYQMSKCFHPEEDWPIDWNLLDTKKEWLAVLQHQVNLSTIEKSCINEETNKLQKVAYHLAYQYFMLAENRVWLDGESKAIVQKIHDCEMPNSYFYELRDKINNLKIEE